MQTVLNLRVGELVQVKSAEEILATLDERGALDRCRSCPRCFGSAASGSRLPARRQGVRRSTGAAAADGERGPPRALRCDGSAHGGCQAGCLIYWKEAWLERVARTRRSRDGDAPELPIFGGTGRTRRSKRLRCPTPERRENGKKIYSCQATELKSATAAEVPWWLPGQYVQDIRSGNATPRPRDPRCLVGFSTRFKRRTRASCRASP